jgi:hypothetical protein
VGTTFRLWLPEADFSEGEREQNPAPAYSLLLLGTEGPALEGTSQFLRQNGFSVVAVTSVEAALEYLRAPLYSFAAALVQNSAQCAALFADMKKERLPVKTILHVIGRNQDELETSLLVSADLVIPADTSGKEMLAKIHSLLLAPPSEDL